MKKTILSIALLISVISSLSSCAVTQDRRGHHGRDRGRHHGPYDSNYRNYNR